MRGSFRPLRVPHLAHTQERGDWAIQWIYSYVILSEILNVPSRCAQRVVPSNAAARSLIGAAGFSRAATWISCSRVRSSRTTSEESLTEAEEPASGVAGTVAAEEGEEDEGDVVALLYPWPRIGGGRPVERLVAEDAGGGGVGAAAGVSTCDVGEATAAACVGTASRSASFVASTSASACATRRLAASFAAPRRFHFCFSSSVLPSPPTTLTPPADSRSHRSGPLGISSPSCMCNTSLASGSRFGPDSPKVQSSVPPYLRGIEDGGMCTESVEVTSAADKMWILFRVPSSNPNVNASLALPFLPLSK